MIGEKIQKNPRFKGSKQMWIGADYSNTTLKWQWRVYYKAFTGILWFLFLFYVNIRKKITKGIA